MIIGSIDEDKKLTLQNSRMKLDVERLLKEALLNDQPKVKMEENSNVKPIKGGYQQSFKRQNLGLEASPMGTPNDMYQPNDHISGSHKYGDSNQFLGETSQIIINERSGGSGSDSGQVTGPVN